MTDNDEVVRELRSLRHEVAALREDNTALRARVTGGLAAAANVLDAHPAAASDGHDAVRRRE